MNALLLIGSPKPNASASRSFGEALLTRLADRGAATRVSRVTPSFRSTDLLARLLDDVGWADLVVLSFPVYVDSLPAPLMRLLEAWADAAAAAPAAGLRAKRLVVLTQCGFPEADQCQTAIAVCREFCREAGVEWAGALAFGTGGALEGRAIERSPLARAVPAFEQAVDALTAGREIPAAAIGAVGRQFAPTWAYTMFGGLLWWRVARRRGGREPLRLRRYPQ
jgi:multimeric flavodoxin WrbA